MRSGPLPAILALVLLLTAPTLAHAENAPDELVCYDVQVSALVVRQVPTDIPYCEDCIVMWWPWITDLQVERVLKGRMPDTPITTVLTIQHTYHRIMARPGRWWLRRNDIGLYNALRPGEDEVPAPCPAGAPPATSYVGLPAGMSFKDFRRETERAALR